MAASKAAALPLGDRPADNSHETISSLFLDEDGPLKSDAPLRRQLLERSFQHTGVIAVS
ncbi:conserved hypothetical protein [Vibrio parahaemolyticus AQ3810]|nr:conserved hypothetical protein [Vibrio parahaemolyticus AQ3810]